MLIRTIPCLEHLLVSREISCLQSCLDYKASTADNPATHFGISLFTDNQPSDYGYHTPARFHRLAHARLVVHSTIA
jgi:hypothetical protein